MKGIFVGVWILIFSFEPLHGAKEWQDFFSLSYPWNVWAQESIELADKDKMKMGREI